MGLFAWTPADTLKVANSLHDELAATLEHTMTQKQQYQCSWVQNNSKKGEKKLKQGLVKSKEFFSF